MWQWHASVLPRYAGAFNGRRILSISLDHRTWPREKIEADFAGVHFDDIVESRNDPTLGETAVFPALLSLIQSTDPDEIFFYAHAKGVSRPADQETAIIAWCDAMYQLCLGNTELIERIMARFDAAGCFQLQMQHAGSSWHYSGTFFWMRHAALFARDWRSIEPNRWGVEGYPGRHIRMERAFCLTQSPPPFHPGSLYGDPVPSHYPAIWMDRLAKAFA